MTNQLWDQNNLLNMEINMVGLLKCNNGSLLYGHAFIPCIEECDR